jgi:hypothetical protein
MFPSFIASALTCEAQKTGNEATPLYRPTAHPLFCLPAQPFRILAATSIPARKRCLPSRMFTRGVFPLHAFAEYAPILRESIIKHSPRTISIDKNTSVMEDSVIIILKNPSVNRFFKIFTKFF